MTYLDKCNLCGSEKLKAPDLDERLRKALPAWNERPIPALHLGKHEQIGVDRNLVTEVVRQFYLLDRKEGGYVSFPPSEMVSIQSLHGLDEIEAEFFYDLLGACVHGHTEGNNLLKEWMKSESKPRRPTEPRRVHRSTSRRR